MKKGFTLIEILTVVSILTVLVSLTFFFFSAYNKKAALEKDVSKLTALIRNARILAVSSKNSSLFGIHLESDKAILFEGNSYIPGGTEEKVVFFSSNIYLSSYSLNGGGADIIFARLTGETQKYGTITLSLKDNSTSTTITILKTGVIK